MPQSKSILRIIGLCACLWTWQAVAARAQAPAFSYQGQLSDNGQPANGAFDLRFILYDMLIGGAQQGPIVTLEDVVVTNGNFTVTLDFGAAAFPGAPRWLEIGVRPGANVGLFTVLTPRQPVGATPYAIRSLSAASADTATNATNATTSVNFSGALAGDVTGTQGATQLANNAVTTAKLADGSVTNAKIVSVDGGKITGTLPVASLPAGSGSYVQNTTTPQASTNFNISGNGTAGGTLAGNIVNATTQYNLNGNRVLHTPGTNSLAVGTGAGAVNTANNNTFLGTVAGALNTTGDFNTFLGRQAGGANSTGQFNTFVGHGTGVLNTNGVTNTFVGASAGAANLTGSSNAFFGNCAGCGNTNGFSNAFFGYFAGASNTTASNNAFFGAAAGNDNTTGADNAFFGTEAGANNDTGAANAFFGRRAGLNNIVGGNNAYFGRSAGGASTGSSNSFFGSQAGLANTSGNNNTIIGAGAEVGAGNLSNATSLGAFSQVNCSNCLVLGSVAGVNSAATSSNVGIGTTAPSAKLEVVSESNTTVHMFATSYGAINNAIIGRQADGTFAAPAATSSGRSLMFLGGRGHTGAGFATVSRVGIGMEATENWTATANGTRITFDTTANGTTSRLERMRIDQNGRVGIGAAAPDARLHVFDTTPSFGNVAIHGEITASSSSNFAVLGEVNNTAPGSASAGVRGLNRGTGAGGVGVWGSHAGSGWGVTGEAALAGIGVRGEAGADGVGVYGEASGDGFGVYGVKPSSGLGAAGFFNGNVVVLNTLTKGAGAFKIDHPLDPANKYLWHSFVESPDMKNIYDGNVTTDAAGLAEIVLPDWFEALNRDFRYQLTVLGQFAQAIVAEKIKDNRFKIRTSLPNVEVSWQVTGIRQDAFAEKNRIPVEEAKPEKERGFYLHPAVFQQPEEKGIEWALRPAMMKEMKAQREKTKLPVPPTKPESEKP